MTELRHALARLESYTHDHRDLEPELCDDIDLLATEVARRWMPIESAPKDGAIIDVWAHGRRYPSVRWMHWLDAEFQDWDIQHLYDARGGSHWECPHIKPTHWMWPVEPPAVSTQE